MKLFKRYKTHKPVGKKWKGRRTMNWVQKNPQNTTHNQSYTNINFPGGGCGFATGYYNDNGRFKIKMVDGLGKAIKTGVLSWTFEVEWHYDMDFFTFVEEKMNKQ
jgi:hypothetical protein